MKRIQYFLFATLISVLVVGLIGCKRKPKGPTPIPGARAMVPGTADPYPPMSGDSSSTGLDSGGPITFPPDSEGFDNSMGDGSYEGGSMLPAADRDNFGGTIEDRDFFAENTVYFDFDRSNIKPEDQSRVEQVATYLQANPADKLRVEGHCDERGTDSYNLALGERRAQSVRELLVVLGINPERIQTLTLGEARPADPGTSEAAYARNRRAEFILLTP